MSLAAARARDRHGIVACSRRSAGQWVASGCPSRAQRRGCGRSSARGVIAVVVVVALATDATTARGMSAPPARPTDVRARSRDAVLWQFAVTRGLELAGGDTCARPAARRMAQYIDVAGRRVCDVRKCCCAVGLSTEGAGAGRAAPPEPHRADRCRAGHDAREAVLRRDGSASPLPRAGTGAGARRGQVVVRRPRGR